MELREADGEGVEWIQLAKVWDLWHVPVNTTMKLGGSGATQLVLFY
jgi:hypothetical protein